MPSNVNQAACGGVIRLHTSFWWYGMSCDYRHAGCLLESASRVLCCSHIYFDENVAIGYSIRVMVNAVWITWSRWCKVTVLPAVFFTRIDNGEETFNSPVGISSAWFNAIGSNVTRVPFPRVVVDELGVAIRHWCGIAAVSAPVKSFSCMSLECTNFCWFSARAVGDIDFESWSVATFLNEV